MPHSLAKQNRREPLRVLSTTTSRIRDRPRIPDALEMAGRQQRDRRQRRLDPHDVERLLTFAQAQAQPAAFRNHHDARDGIVESGNQSLQRM